MKKIITILIIIFIQNVYANDLYLFNKSESDDIYVTYKFCRDNNTSRICDKPISSLIHPLSKKYKNFIVETIPNDQSVVIIVNALKKDSFGNVTVKSTYDSDYQPHCGYFTHDNVAIIFDDQNKAPIITCLASGFSTEK